MGKLLNITSIMLVSTLSIFMQAAYADDKKFTMAVIGDPQFPWTCKDEGDYEKFSDYCSYINRDDKSIDQAKDSNRYAIQEIKQLKNSLGTNFKGLIINGDLTAFGHPGEREDFNSFYDIKSKDLVIYPGLGNHDYQNNINKCGGNGVPTHNRCAGGMMHLMADWVLGYKGLDKGKPRFCDKKLKSCDIAAFNKNFAQRGGNRNVNGSMAYSWEIGDFLFIQLQNYPHYTANFKRGYSSGVSSWTMNATSSMGWLKTQLNETIDTDKTKGKNVILNMHNIEYYFGLSDQAKKDKADLENLLKQHSNKIRAVFVGHHHQAIGVDSKFSYGTEIAGIPIIYSGSPISGRFIKADFDSSKSEDCIVLTQVNTTINKSQELRKIQCS